MILLQENTAYIPPTLRKFAFNITRIILFLYTSEKESRMLAQNDIMIKKFLPLLLYALFGIVSAEAQQNYALLIHNKTFELPENKGKIKIQCGVSKNEVFNGIMHVYIQFYTLPSNEEKKAFEEKGVHFLSYIPNNTYVCAIAKNVLKNISDTNLRSISLIDSKNKLNPVLSNSELPPWALKPNNQIDLMVFYYADLKHEEVRAALTKNKYYIVSESEAMHHFQIRVKTDAIHKVATHCFLSYIDPERAPATPENEVERANHRSYAIDNNLTGSNGLHYDGTGVNVAVGDDGIIGPHIDYTGRANQTWVTTNIGDHGDHVCGILAGAGNLNPKAKGAAPGCSLFIYRPYENINNLPAHYGLYKIRITSLSYGQGCNAGYTSDANSLDEMMRIYPAAISVFSAGNSGNTNCNYQNAGVTGWGNITGGMKTGKNVIAVANLWNTDSVDVTSSRGPASDGRIKPDISSVGTNVFSTISTNNYSNNSGTSMACPAISGVMAQLYQAFRVNNNAQDPTGALMKGILLNTADDIGNPGPDYKYGFGRVNALRALHVIENKSYLEESVSNQDTMRLKFAVPANVKKVKIMLYYADKEAANGASKALVNDLNMVVLDRWGRAYYPWVLNPAPNSNTLNAPATQKIDSLNNMEQVTIDNPEPGLTFVFVNGFSVPFGPQNFYIIYDFIYDSLKLVYPLGNDRWSPNTNETIRWDSWNSVDTITLQTSVDNVSWNTISSTIPGKNRLFSYTPAASNLGKLWVKIKQGSNESVTSQFINVTTIPTNLKLDWICSGSCRISWSAVANASSYTVYRLGTKYMDSVANTSKTYFVFTGIDSTVDDWFSVKTLMSNDEVAGERANAIKKTKLIKLNCATTLTVDFTNSRNNICTNDTLSFTPITNASNGFKYAWKFGGGTPASSTLSNPIVKYNAPGTYSVTLAVSDSLGGAAMTKNLFITVIGVAADAGIDQTICAGDSVILSGKGGVSFMWAFNKAIIANTATIKVAPTQTALYSLNTTSTEGCKSNDSVTIFVNPTPTKPIITSNSIALSSNSMAATYQWFIDGVEIPSALEASYIPTTHGLYQLRIGNTSSCYSYSNEVFFVPVGIYASTMPQNISLFPNPNTGSFNIHGVDTSSSIMIYDVIGKEVTPSFERTNYDNDKIHFRNSDLSKGVYLVCLKTKDQSKTLKIMLQ